MPKRAKKKVEPEAADMAVVSPVETSETKPPETHSDAEPAARLEPDEPELKATAKVGRQKAAESGRVAAPRKAAGRRKAPRVEAEAGAPVEAATPLDAAPGEVEALAEAADTFEQAFEERELPAHPGIAVPELKVSEATGDEAAGEIPSAAGKGDDDEEEFTPELAAPAKLERLQKILSQAGVASRRHAEEMIQEGRVQVNGKVVTELGSKADPNRDHIRVDGKLLHGAERHRYFVLNKPKGYVTTVSDPQGRPTVMEFFSKMGERLYPVGRLDFLSEGLLLVTNDGDLANKLTKAATGVEKTYLVKVSGQPTEDQLDQLRSGVGIDRGRPGEGRVQTGSASIRQVRQGDNPWYEVVLTEGRNREIRKMFEEIGHFVEKIRRVGYGPLILDQEPGQFRELDAGELARLRLAAEGKWRTPKPKQPRKAEAGSRGKPPRREAGRRPAGGREERFEAGRPVRPRGEWRGPGAGKGEGQGTRQGARPGSDRRPAARAEEARREETRRPGIGTGDRRQGFGPRKPAAGFGARGAEGGGSGQRRPEWNRQDRGGARTPRFNSESGARGSGAGNAPRPVRSDAGRGAGPGYGRTREGTGGGGWRKPDGSSAGQRREERPGTNRARTEFRGGNRGAARGEAARGTARPSGRPPRPERPPQQGRLEITRKETPRFAGGKPAPSGGYDRGGARGGGSSYLRPGAPTTGRGPGNARPAPKSGGKPNLSRRPGQGASGRGAAGPGTRPPSKSGPGRRTPSRFDGKRPGSGRGKGR
jgi:23S rRNA pseudouridine2605 synthase